MANELKAVFALSATSGPATGSATVSSTWVASQGCADILPSIGTSEESLSFVDVTNNGWVQITNADTTNFVDVGFSTGVYGIRLLAGEKAQFRLKPSATIYIKADTAACRCRVVHFGGV